ncbi:uncharacterized protein LOC111526523 isoform X6 [Piliocolobus tephrosceles]|uniref:uncharacterized protein LOC111526523 isoform X6 n=1 Tax=Piliocolobus tephrosceles TaxID=591936 RepID=UPI000C2B4C21|nr:uncharacterized protein LOC111526523 isoform X6 [Piliocolobus tephrosceles]
MVRHACFPFTFCRACKSPETSKPCFLNSLQHWVLEPVPHKHQRMTLYSSAISICPSCCDTVIRQKDFVTQAFAKPAFFKC